MRTFIAIELPAVAQKLLQTWQNQLQQQLSRDGLADVIRWTASANIHLTLRFLGETNESQCSRLYHSLTTLVQPVAAFHLWLNVIGCFPNWRAPNIIWVGIGGETERLGQLQAQIERMVQQAGFAPEPKPFRPHLTIGRVLRDTQRTKLAGIGENLQGIHLHGAHQEVGTPKSSNNNPTGFTTGEILHIQSQLRPTGPLYRRLAHFTLAEK